MAAIPATVMASTVAGTSIGTTAQAGPCITRPAAIPASAPGTIRAIATCRDTTLVTVMGRATACGIGLSTTIRIARTGLYRLTGPLTSGGPITAGIIRGCITGTVRSTGCCRFPSGWPVPSSIIRTTISSIRTATIERRANDTGIADPAEHGLRAGSHRRAAGARRSRRRRAAAKGRATSDHAFPGPDRRRSRTATNRGEQHMRGPEAALTHSALPTRMRETLSRAQMELVASRVSYLNERHY
jgi:hypothetical protein